MKGKYNIIIESKDVKYEFTIKRHFTKIIGASATGKTHMVGLIRSKYAPSYCVEDRDIAIIAPAASTWKLEVTNLENCIIVLDEDCDDLTTDESCKFMAQSNNYFILISREYFSNISYSPTEVYSILTDDKGKVKHYNSLVKHYKLKNLDTVFFGSFEDIKNNLSKFNYRMITEDSNSGFEFFKSIFPTVRDINNDIIFDCLTGNGKNGILTNLESKYKEYNNIILIVDGAAFDSCIDRLISYMLANKNKNIIVFMPESFEYLLLKARYDNKCKNILNNTYNYCEYSSWEVFYTKLLERLTYTDEIFQYKKKHLNTAYSRYYKEVLNELLKSNIILSLSNQLDYSDFYNNIHSEPKKKYTSNELTNNFGVLE